MNILTDYYKFERIATKARLRLDNVASTCSYPEFEEKRATKAIRATEKRDATEIGDLVVYYGDVPEHFGGNVHRKAGKSLTIKGKNLSSVYIPDVHTNFGYGDIRGTSDAVLFIFDRLEVINGALQAGGQIEMFIARGKSRECVPLYNMLAGGELDDELNRLRGEAMLIKSVTNSND